MRSVIGVILALAFDSVIMLVGVTTVARWRYGYWFWDNHY